MASHVEDGFAVREVCPFHLGVALKIFCDRISIFIVGFHSNCQRLGATKYEPGIPWPGNRANGVLIEGDTFTERRIVGRSKASNDIECPLRYLVVE